MTAATPWWATFFDDAYVETWTEHGAFEETAESAAQLLRLLDLPDGARVLDIPCGFGRFSKPLHDAGHAVVGVDASPDQIRRARRDNPGPDYRVGDMREPPSGPFDAVVNLFSSFGYFDDPEDDLRCLRTWHQVLRPGGQLVVETMHRDRLAWQFDPEGRPEPGTEAGTTNWVSGVRTTQVRLGDDVREFRVRLYTATELVRALADVGFVDVTAHGDLAGAPLDPSTRLVVHGLRAA